MRKNIANSFPELNTKQRQIIERKFYRHLADITVESIKAFTTKSSEIVKRHQLINAEILNELAINNTSIILVTGHYGNWEYGAISAPIQSENNFLALYKRIKNPFLDNYIKQNRSRTGTELVNINETSEAFEKHHNNNTVFLMAADQRPGKKHLARSYKVHFLNQETSCLYGPEKYAKKYNLPVLYLEILRHKRGFYKLYLEPLSLNPKDETEGEITRKFMTRLEKTIRSNPESWLWSHDRWKYSNILGTA